MKKGLLLATALLLAPSVYADSTAYKTRIVFDGGLAVNNGSYASADIDLAFTARFVTAHGWFTTNQGLASPATGSCFTTTSGGVYCNFQIDQLSVNMTIEASLSGTASIKAADGTILSTAPARLSVAN